MSGPGTTRELGSRLLGRVGRMLDEFESRWTASTSEARPRIEQYLSDHQSFETSAILFHLLSSELELRKLAGEEPMVDEYLQRFPDRSSVVQDAFQQTPFGPLTSPATAANRGAFVPLLMGLKPFCDLPEAVIDGIASLLTERRYESGERLIRQGEPAGGLIVLVDGEVDVNLSDERGQQHVVCRNVRRCVIGEIALLTGEPHSADVVATTPVRALVLAADDFPRVVQSFPTLAVGFADIITSRLGKRDVDALYDKVIGGYRVKRRLGYGGMAVVYEGEEIATGRRIALKMMRHPLAYDPRSVKRFRHEAAVIESLRHRNIVQVHQCIAAYNTFFIVMEYCDGPTLSRLINTFQPLTEEQVRPILGQLAAGLTYAHAQGVIHRDLKPANVMLQRDGVLRLSDFGLARSLLSGGLTREGEIVGTPRYMPPEQLLGSHVDHRADIFSFGCIAFELLAGKPLFDQVDIMSLLQQQMYRRCPPSQMIETARLKDSPPLNDNLRNLIDNSLAPDPNDRRVDLNSIAEWSADIDPQLLHEVAIARVDNQPTEIHREH